MTDINKVVHKTMADILSLGYDDFAVVVNVKASDSTSMQLAFATTDDAMDRIDTNSHRKVVATVTFPDDEANLAEKSDDKDGN